MSRRTVTLTVFVTFFIVALRRWSNVKQRMLLIYAWRRGLRFYNTYPNLVKDIRYADARPRQTLDVYWPRHGDRLPVLFFVHGGSWSTGDKNIYPLLGKSFIAHDFVVVIINYSHFPSETFPAYVEDAAAALAWTVDHIADYHGDPDQIFIVGHSAGAHILSLVALDDRYLAAHRLTRNIIRGFICISSPTDLTLLLEHVASRPDMGTCEQVIALMGGPDRLHDADPVSHARPDAPPTLFIHGSDDTTAPIELARSFAAALTRAGAPVQFLEYPGATHISLLLDGVLPSRHPLRLLIDTTTFMRRLVDQVV